MVRQIFPALRLLGQVGSDQKVISPNAPWSPPQSHPCNTLLGPTTTAGVAGGMKEQPAAHFMAWCDDMTMQMEHPEVHLKKSTRPLQGGSLWLPAFGGVLLSCNTRQTCCRSTFDATACKMSVHDNSSKQAANNTSCDTCLTALLSNTKAGLWTVSARVACCKLFPVDAKRYRDDEHAARNDACFQNLSCCQPEASCKQDSSVVASQRSNSGVN